MVFNFVLIDLNLDVLEYKTTNAGIKRKSSDQSTEVGIVKAARVTAPVISIIYSRLDNVIDSEASQQGHPGNHLANTW